MTEQEDYDSGMESGYSSDMTSITSSNYDFVWRDGRRYHAIIDNPYSLPNDEEEMIRLDKLDYALTSLYGRNVLVKLHGTPSLILDLGTGSGTWAIRVALKFPKTRVVGMDLSPVSTLNLVEAEPDNCEFMVGDITQGSLEDFDDGSADLIHSRFVQGGIREQEWQNYICEIHRILKPDHGWAQVGELNIDPISNNNSCPESSALREFSKIAAEWAARERFILGGEHLEDRFIQAGFVDVKVIQKTLDIGDWRGDPKTAKIGLAAREAFCGAIEMSTEMVKYAYPENERKAFLKRVVEDWSNPAYQLYLIVHTVVGRKVQGDQS